MNLLHLVGTGTVARNKETNSKICLVFLPNYFPAGDGLISGTANTAEATGQSKDGTKNSSKVLNSNVVPATWINLNGGNRLTPPDVRVGTQVAIYRWGDDPELHWTTIGFSSESMRLETVIYGFSANPNTDKNNPFNYDSFYTMEVSTHSKRVAFKTSQINGEKTRHEIALDTGKGVFTIADGEGNLLAVDAANHSFIYQNQEKSKFIVNKKQILISCEDQAIINAKTKITINAETINLNAKLINVVAPNTKLKGNIQMQGNFKSKGNMDVDGGINATGTINGEVDVIGGGISVKGHGHSGVKKGEDQSGPPVAG